MIFCHLHKKTTGILNVSKKCASKLKQISSLLPSMLRLEYNWLERIRKRIWNIKKTSSEELISSAQFFTVRFNGSLVVLDLGFCNWLESCQFTADSLDFLEVFPLLSTRQPWRVGAAVIIWIQSFLHHYKKKFI